MDMIERRAWLHRWTPASGMAHRRYETAWLLDVYASPGHGLTLWLLCQDENEGLQRLRLHQDFPVTFYAAGPPARLRQLWRFLKSQPIPLKLSRAARRDLFQPHPVTVLAIEVAQPADQPGLFRQVSQAFPDLTYYDADLPIALRHAAVYSTFPLARCQVETDQQGKISQLVTLDTPWELDAQFPPLQILSMEPDIDPSHAEPRHLLLRQGRFSYRLALEPARPFLINLRAILQRHDPDLLLTMWGDTWLLPHLLALARRWDIPLPLNRDANRPISYRPERTYFTYGQVVYRGRQVHLYGRWHLDAHNAMLFHDYGLEGVLEMARVTALPVQMAARLSPGTGISSMQMQTALRLGILVPWHKQQAEQPKTALDLFGSDQGGLVYQPIPGLYSHVAEIDFISMYPSIMARFNISPETVGTGRPAAEPGAIGDRQSPGLVPQTLQPLLDKRLALKSRLAMLPAWDPRRHSYQARASAHKWLLVTCFGYLGYKNARFGRIEAHEAVTAYGREALLRAKEAAEDLGFSVLHMYVDGLWIQKEGTTQPGDLMTPAVQPADFQPVLDEIARRTGLPIALDGIYRWVAFLSSRQDQRVPVANRYFGVFQDNSLKLRGIETRRQDTPPFIAETQLEILQRMARASDASSLPDCLPEILALLRRRLADLRRGRVSLEKLLVSQKMSKALDEYRDPSPAARAARQLAACGKTVKQGQRVRFVYTRGKPGGFPSHLLGTGIPPERTASPLGNAANLRLAAQPGGVMPPVRNPTGTKPAAQPGVHAWNLPQPPDPASVDVARYTTLLIRAASNVLQPLGVDEATLRQWLLEGASYNTPPGHPDALPLLATLSSGRPPPSGDQKPANRAPRPGLVATPAPTQSQSAPSGLSPGL
jgi:DNA polymerase-2